MTNPPPECYTFAMEERKKKGKFDFDKFVQDILEFKKEFGHVCVPVKYKPLWTSVKRIRNGAIKLTDAQINKLVELGFVWNAHEYTFEIRYQELLEFKEKFGHVRVPRNYGSLGSWVAYIRKPDKASEEQKSRLNKIGFVWDISEYIFDQRFK